ncbi:S41 family peptidase [Aureibacter tunicatorum]|uniref:C-terminal processing protease CtpA/Prc n=1 Tax=Aureibacter tunicatorum TaxID=866807 RepID=A0AAE4BV07_9BACT|nr:S41 family peptidase [Aureibacter tunicatorum]MDR6241377.1 C-terminal processing protease CtpA/Prc [Aureibacter tunicatorum]BDD06778.1 hypothetical protein AUTU_42610 [Aureibacter tunicatorum]
MTQSYFLKFVIALAFLMFSNSISRAQELSETDKLYRLAKVWGFLKYYHPQVAKGEVDWDNELYEIMESQKAVYAKTDYSNLLNSWLLKQGKLKKIKHKDVKNKENYFDDNYDLTWLSDTTLFAYGLSENLRFIEGNRYKGRKNHYLQFEKKSSGVRKGLINEKLYTSDQWQNQSFRMMILFRYWNIIEYFYPHKYTLEKSWDFVLQEFIPKFLYCDSEKDFHLLLLELVCQIKDSHAYVSSEVLTKYFGEYQTPFSTKLINGKAVVYLIFDDSLAIQDDIRVGDVITKVDGKTISEIYKENEKYISSSNDSRKDLVFTWGYLGRGVTDEVEIEFARDDLGVEKKVIRRYTNDEFEKDYWGKQSWSLIDNDIAYINLRGLNPDSLDLVMRQIKDTKALIVDIRNYPKIPWYSFRKHLEKDERLFAKFYNPIRSHPGRLVYSASLKHFPYTERGVDKYEGELIVLVNEESQSFAETMAMYFQSFDQTTVIGSQTSGADGNVIGFELFEGAFTCYTFFGMFYPDGKAIQRIGIVPDIEIKPTVKGVQEGKDEVLDGAVEWFKQKQSSF